MANFSPQVVKRIMSDLKDISEIPPDSLQFRVKETGRIDQWEIQVFQFDPSKLISTDIEKYKVTTGRDYLQFILTFPENYPQNGPNMRLIQPRLTTTQNLGGIVYFNGFGSTTWNPNQNAAYKFGEVFNFMLNDQNPGIVFANMTPYNLEEAQKGYQAMIADHQKDFGNFSPVN
jgi:ubiquitin-protein ligase